MPLQLLPLPLPPLHHEPHVTSLTTMLHLKPSNLLIQKTLSEALAANSNGTPLILDRIISDFDYTSFHVSNSPDDRTSLLLSIKTKAWQSIANCTSPNGSSSRGFLAFLSDKYDSLPGIELLTSTPEPGFDCTLRISLGQLSDEGIMQLSLLKTIVMSYPFHLAFEEFGRLSAQAQQQAPDQIQQSSGTLYTIQYRDDENIFIKPAFDRVTVIFETIFQDETDKILGKVFLQEFVDARKRNRGIQSAPQVLFSQEPPLELQGQTTTTAAAVQGAGESSSRRFITFVLFPRHFQTPELQFSSISHLTLFRNYFHYHIKCSKAYMHTRMRSSVNRFVKVLNRAKVDGDDDEINDQKIIVGAPQSNLPTRRTITGRKMVY